MHKLKASTIFSSIIELPFHNINSSVQYPISFFFLKFNYGPITTDLTNLTGQSVSGCQPVREQIYSGKTLCVSVSLTTMVPSLPWLRWNCSRSLKGKSQMTSELRTKNGSLSMFSSSRANARGPAAHKYTHYFPLFLIFLNYIKLCPPFLKGS